MRLLKTYGADTEAWQPELVDFRGEAYAILSHRWLQNANDEVLFTDIKIIDDGGRVEPDHPTDFRRHTKYQYNSHISPRTLTNILGYDKLRSASRQALHQGYSFIWIDTCCIDKSSSAELSEAINSMYKWYRDSQICFAYLSDVPDGKDSRDTSVDSAFAKSAWWTRGWTLQELVAPTEVVFYTQGWEPIGQKKLLADAICAASGIGIDVLTHARPLDQISVARRMSWASSRKTKRLEDRAYSLMGIFDVAMPLLYGEGEKAFLRLQEEIMKSSDDESIFAWINPDADDDQLHGLLADDPSYFFKSGRMTYYQDFEDREPYVMSNRGLSISLRMSHCQEEGCFAAALHCPVPQTGDGFLAVFLKCLDKNTKHFARMNCSRLGSIENRGTLETIFIRQNHDTRTLERVLPYSSFITRREIVGEEGERYQLTHVTQGGSYQSGGFDPLSPMSHAKSWDNLPPEKFRIIRGERKLTVALLFEHVSRRVWSRNKSDRVSGLVIMLGSTSITKVGFDAQEMDHLPAFDSMENMFRPRTAGQWIKLPSFHVKVDFQPLVQGTRQIFIAKVAIQRITNPSPLGAVVDVVPHPVGKPNSVWKRLLRDG